MDKDQKPQSNSEKQADKKSSPQGGNLVWYMLAVGVLLLLFVTMFSTNSGVTLGISDLLNLISVSGKDANGKEGIGYIDIPDPSTTRPQQRAPRLFTATARASDLIRSCCATTARLTWIAERRSSERET